MRLTFGSPISIAEPLSRQFIKEHPLEILAHAAKHDYPKLIRDVAPALVRHPVMFVAEQLPSRYVIPWVSPPLLNVIVQVMIFLN